MSEPTQIVLGRLEQRGFDPRPLGPDSWESRCPAHDGRRHNLSIKTGEDGRCLIHCHHADEGGANCPAEAILSALGLTMSDLFRRDPDGSKIASQAKPTKSTVVAKSKKVHASFNAAVDAVAWGLRQPKGGKADGTWHYQSRWTYQDADGKAVFAVARFQNAEGDAGRKDGKVYRPIHKTDSGFLIGDPPGPLPLYHLPELAGCRRVYVAEGEKCADLVRDLKLTATTPSHGAKSPHKSDWSPLAGVEVIILPDSDAPGEGFAKSVVAQLAKVDPVPTVRVVRLPGLGEGEDIEQWLATWRDDRSPGAPWREEARAELEHLADSTPETQVESSGASQPAGEAEQRPGTEASWPRLEVDMMVRAKDRDNIGKVVGIEGRKASVHFRSPNGHENTVSLDISILEPINQAGGPPVWSGDPRPIQSKLRPVPPFPTALIPEPLRDWLVDIAERVSCSPDFPVVGAVNALAALVGRKAGIRPKRQDDWKVVPNLWGGIVGRPGVFKTPALMEAMRPLQRLAKEAMAQFDEEMNSFATDSLLIKVRADNAKEEVKKAVKAKKSDDEIAVLARMATAAEGVEEPICRRYIVNDPTVEKLGELLRENPDGLMIFRDELTGWFRSLDKYGHESDRAFYLEAWNGGGAAFTYDRIGRGTIVIPSPCVSVLGGIQPGPLRSYLKAVARGEDADDGLISRFQLLVYPDPPAEWINVDRWPDTDAKNRAFAIFRRLDELDPVSAGAEADPEDGVAFFRFAPEAQDLFDEWRGDLENQKLRIAGESQLIESHLSKYRSLMPSLAFLFHLVDLADGRASGHVSLEAAQLAAAWCDYLEAHARRIYSLLDEVENDAARSLVDHIKKGDLPSPFAARDVYRKGWSNLSTSEDATRAVAMLEELGWLQSVETHNTGGAPRTDIHLHPSLVKSEVPA